MSNKLDPQKLKEHAEKEINHIDTKIKEYTEKLNSNFLYHLSWRCEDLYKHHYIRQFWQYLIENIDNGEDIDAYVEHCIEFFTRRIMRQYPKHNSTNAISNLQQLWDNECHIKMLEFYKDVKKGLYEIFWQKTNTQ